LALGEPFEGAAFSPLLGGLGGAIFAFAIVWENNAVKRRFWGKGKSRASEVFKKGTLKQNVFFQNVTNPTSRKFFTADAVNFKSICSGILLLSPEKAHESNLKPSRRGPCGKACFSPASLLAFWYNLFRVGFHAAHFEKPALPNV
jgi:hypothetical protein